MINTLIFKPAFFYLIFLNIIGVSSLFKISGYGYFNTFNFFEIIFVIYTFFLIILTKNKDGFKIGLLFLIYCLLNFFIASINEKITIGFVKDFIALNKFYLICIFLPFYLRNKNEYSLKEIIKLKHLINLLILIFIIKYLISKFLADGTIFSQRPGVFGENNFELFLICVLSLFFFIEDKKKILLVIAIILLSGSRSSILAFFFSFLYLYKRKINIKNISLIIIFFLISSYIVFIRSNYSSIDEFDRYVFFNVFLNEISDWNFINYIFGSKPITYLENQNCIKLIYYEILFSYKNDLTCTSVVLHSFWLRIFYDHGLFGIMIIILLLNKLLKNSNIDKKNINSFFIIILFYGLSVSGLNNIFAIISIIIILDTKYFYKYDNYNNNFNS